MKRGMMRYSGIRIRGILLLLIGAATAISVSALVIQNSPADLLKISDEIAAKVSQLRGLDPTGPIRKGVKTREEISQYLREHVRSNFDEKELKNEGRLLQKLGLIPATMNYTEFTVKLLTEQVGGYYDPDKKTFFIAAWLPADQQKPVMAHELTHALQDQHFDLSRILNEDRKLQNDDRLLAHMALFEGDATAVMLDYILEPLGRSFAKVLDLVYVMRSQFSAMEAEFEIFRQSPDYLKETMVFPYAYGASFLQKVRASQPWSAVDKIYSDLPESTEQIIHPEKYTGVRDSPKPLELQDPSPRLGTGWHSAYGTVLGEFELFVLLKLILPEERARIAAAGWGGDKVLLLEDKSGATAVFGSTVWDTADDADEFYLAMTDWLQGRYPKARRTEETTSGVSLVHAGEYCSLKKTGDRVEFVIGLPESEAAKLKTR
jgi:hypothetical protein